MRSRHALAGVVGVGLLVTALTISISPPEQTEAAWARATTARGSFTAGTTLPPTGLACSGGGVGVVGNPPSVTFTWAAPTGSLPLSGYIATLYLGATVVSTTTNAALGIVIPGNTLATGVYTLTVVSDGPGVWDSTAVSGTYNKTAPILGILLGAATCSVP